jgi:hypothetical protein
MFRRIRTPNGRQACVAAAFFACVTAAYTWPLPLHLASAVPHDSGDPLLVTWILWWSTHVTPLTSRWWNAPAFFPSRGVFAFSETLLGLAPITAPLLWLGTPPLLAYNVAFLASFFLSGMTAYVLGFVLTRRHEAACVSGVAFAFSPYRLAHLNHLQLLAAFWMPLGLAALHLYAGDGRRRWAVMFGAAWLLQALTSGYYFFLFSLLAAGWLLCFAVRWPAKRLGTIVLCWFVAALLMLPLLAGYKRIQDSYGFHRVPSEIAYYSADVEAIASAPADSRFWRGLHTIDQPESQLFPGLTMLLLIAAGLILQLHSNRKAAASASTRSGRLLSFYLLAALAMWLLSLGPAPAFGGRPLGLAGPYRLLMLLPGFNGIRVPARFWMMAVLCLAAAGAIVISRIRSSRARLAAAAIAVIGLLIDGWPSPILLGADPGMQVTHTDAIARLGLPLDGNETETMYGAIAQQRPVFNGYSGYMAPQHYALADLLERGDVRILQRLAAEGPIEVVVRHDLDPQGRWRRFLSSVPGARLAEATSTWSVFRVQSTSPAPSAAAGSRLAIAHLSASVDDKDVGAVVDGNLDSRWHAAPQESGATIVIDLGNIQRPSAVVMSLGAYAAQYPRTLDISLSMDGASWEQAWIGDTALATYDAAVASPRDIPVTIPLPRREARYVRLSEVGSSPRGWSIVELEVAR